MGGNIVYLVYFGGVDAVVLLMFEFIGCFVRFVSRNTQEFLGSRGGGYLVRVFVYWLFFEILVLLFQYLIFFVMYIEFVYSVYLFVCIFVGRIGREFGVYYVVLVIFWFLFISICSLVLVQVSGFFYEIRVQYDFCNLY